MTHPVYDLDHDRPFVLLRGDVLSRVHIWVTWMAAQMKVLDENELARQHAGVDHKTVKAAARDLARLSAHLEHVACSSPIVYFRSTREVVDDGPDIPMPPATPGEVGH